MCGGSDWRTLQCPLAGCCWRWLTRPHASDIARQCGQDRHADLCRHSSSSSSSSSSPAATGTACHAELALNLGAQPLSGHAAPEWSSRHTAGRSIPRGRSRGALQHGIPLPPDVAGPHRTGQLRLLGPRAPAAAGEVGSDARPLACMASAGCCQQLQASHGLGRCIQHLWYTYWTGLGATT